MPKDMKKNRYFQIGMGWESWTLSQLEADAELHQMADQPAKLIVLRLTEYYRLVEKGIITPGVTAMMQQPAQVQTAPMNGHANGASSNGRRSGSAAAPAAHTQEPQTGTITESDAAGDNADAALDYFSMDEDE